MPNHQERQETIKQLLQEEEQSTPPPQNTQSGVVIINGNNNTVVVEQPQPRGDDAQLFCTLHDLRTAIETLRDQVTSLRRLFPPSPQPAVLSNQPHYMPANSKTMRRSHFH